MQFKWIKTSGRTELIETTDKNHRPQGAANYLAKNVGTVCGANLERLSEAQRWLSTFRLGASRAAQRRHAAVAEINGMIGRFVEIQYADLYELAMDDDDPATSARNDLRNAAQRYAVSYVRALLTSRPEMSPLLVRNDEITPEIRLREPRDVVDAILSVPPGPATGVPWTRDGLRVPIARALDRLFPHGRSWIEPETLETWHDELWRSWGNRLNLLPLAAAPVATAGLPVPVQPSPVQPSPVQPSPVQPSPARGIDEQPDPELSQPPVRTAQDDERHAGLLAALEAAAAKPMATLRRHERESLITVLKGELPPELLGLSQANGERLGRLRQSMAQSHDAGAASRNWAAALAADGFDLRGLPETISRLEKAGQSAQAQGYYFQVRETLEAWSQYRLCAVEVRLPGSDQPWPRPDRYVDTLEWVAPGEFRFREYKAYNPTGEPPADHRRTFIVQNDDYWAAIFGNPFGYAVEYVFEHGVPAWTEPIFAENARYFAYGLYVTDLTAGSTRRIV
ncbi:hypothetical protein [Actinocorallia longicatena]|uniref:Uncharacterized protein n=1 Tax=Actinocorallia longicatena TaxID=111803 RepID=A0ABP6QGQ5_9ACTN